MASLYFSAVTAAAVSAAAGPTLQPPWSSLTSASPSYSVRSCLSFSNHTTQLRQQQQQHRNSCSLSSLKKVKTIRYRNSEGIVCMAPEEEKMTRRSPLDFPIEWERPKPGRRPDIFPQFSPMKTPLPTPMPADPPEEDEDEEEKKEEEEEDPDKEDQDNPDK
ncbi:hypothetical protein vseg_007219 [Gypsophila vaccaria]